MTLLTNTTKALSGAILLTGLTTGLANAQSYHHSQAGYYAQEACKAKESKNKIVGGGIGAVLGGVVGSQVAGRGARTEGSAIGAVIGGLAGVGIADKNKHCGNRAYRPNYVHQGTTYSSGPVYSSGNYRTVTPYTAPAHHYGSTTTVSNHPVYSNPSYGAGSRTVYTQPTYSQPTYTTRTYTQPTTRSYGHTGYRTTTYSAPRRHHATSRRHTSHNRHYHGTTVCNSRH